VTIEGQAGTIEGKIEDKEARPESKKS